MKKRPTVAQLKKKLDKLVSLHVRRTGGTICYTCKKERDTLQCGHFITRARSATRYHPDNLRVQCVNCNVWRRGEIAFFADYLREEIGKKRFDELIALGKTTKQFSVRELEAMIKEYEGVAK